MQQNKNYDVSQRGKQLIKENQDMFVALEELDRTGKLRKLNYKKRFNFTLDENIMHEFRLYCKKNTMNMSAKIESMIKEYLKKELR